MTIALQPLTQKEDIGNAFLKHLAAHKKFMPKKRYEVIKHICKKLVGNVCRDGQFFMKYEKIAKSVKCCDKTVRLAVKLAVDCGIFKVTHREVKTNNNKYRKTTNLIQLLPYVGYKYEREVRNIESEYGNKKMEEIQEFLRKKKEQDAVKSEQKTKAVQGHTYPKSAHGRTEIMPDWIANPDKYVNEEPPTKEQIENRKALQEKLKRKYKKKEKP